MKRVQRAVKLWRLRGRIQMKVTDEPSVSFPGSVDDLFTLAARLAELGHRVSIEEYARKPALISA